MAHVLLFPMLYVLYFHISNFRCKCVILFVVNDYLLSRYVAQMFSERLEMIPVARIINSITFVFYSIIIIIIIIISIDSGNLLGSLFNFRVSVVFPFLR
jgi:hypothetical protein